MLVLKIKEKRKLTIINQQTNEVLTVHFNRTTSGSAQIAVDAPDHYKILREPLMLHDNPGSDSIHDAETPPNYIEGM